MSHTCNQVRDKLNTFDERSQQLGLKTHRWKVKRLGRHMEKRISNMGRNSWNTKTASMILTTSPNVFWLVYKNTIASILCPIHINAWEESFKLKRQQMIGMLAINCLRVCPTGGWKAEEKRRINKKNIYASKATSCKTRGFTMTKTFWCCLVQSHQSSQHAKDCHVSLQMWNFNVDHVFYLWFLSLGCDMRGVEHSSCGSGILAHGKRNASTPTLLC